MLGGLALVAWVVFYQWAFGMACAFSGAEGSRNCRFKAPWELRGEDLVALVLVPGGVVLLLFFLSWITGRRRG